MRQKADGAGSGEPVPCFPDADNLPRKLVMPQAELKPQAKHVQAKNPGQHKLAVLRPWALD